MGLGKDETAKGSQQQRASGSADMLRLDFSLTQKTAKLHKEPAARPIFSIFHPFGLKALRFAGFNFVETLR
jgi:hypothetical protein